MDPLTADATTICLLDFSNPSNVIADLSGNQRIGRVRGGHWHMVDAARSGRILPDSDQITIRDVETKEPFVETQPLSRQTSGIALYRSYLELENTGQLVAANRNFTAEMWFTVNGSENWKLLSAASPSTSNFVGLTRNGWTINYNWNPSVTAKHAISWTGRRGAISWTTKKPAQRWRHFAVCHEAGTLTVFLDGTFFGRADTSTHRRAIKDGWPPTSGNLIIGSKSAGSREGRLIVQSFRLSSNVRYFQSFQPPAELADDRDTDCLLRFDGGVDSLPDLSNNGRNGKLSSASNAWVEYQADPQVHHVNVARILTAGGPSASLPRNPAVPGNPSTSGPKVRRPVPGTNELEAARKEFQDVFGTDIEKSVTATTKRSLARRFSGLAEATNDFDAIRYVLYLESARMGLKSGDRQTALQSLNACEQYFDSDMTRQVLAVFRESLKTVSKGDAVRFSTEVIREVKSALKEEKTQKASALAEIASDAATKSRDTTMRKLAKEAKDQCLEMVVVIDSFKQGQVTLKTNPADEGAIEAVACYHYQFKRDWKAASAVLTKHPSPDVQTAVKSEVDEKLVATPHTLGDIWLKPISTLNTELDKLCASRAVYWYQPSLSQLSGLERLQAEKKIKNLKELHQLN